MVTYTRLLLIFARNVCEKPPLTFHIQAILNSMQTMVDCLFSRAENTGLCLFMSAFIYKRDAVAVLYAGIISINIVAYRYSCSLCIFHGAWIDAHCYWPVNTQHRLLCHVTTSDS